MVKIASPELRAEVVERYESGASLKAIAAEAFVGASTVRRILIEEGVQLRPPGGCSPRLAPREVYVTARLYEQGVPLERIGAILGGVTRGAITQRVRRAGVPPRPRSGRRAARAGA